MYYYTILYQNQTKGGCKSNFTTGLNWHRPIQKGDVLLLVCKTTALPEEEDKIVPKEIGEQVAWKVDEVVHSPNCSLFGGTTILLVSPTERPAGV